MMYLLDYFLEPSVRVELMEQVPHVAVYCYEHHSMMEAVPQYILFIVLRFLTDSNNQVQLWVQTLKFNSRLHIVIV